MGAVAIVRISGPAARDIARRCFRPAHPAAWAPQRLRRGWIEDPGTGERIDEGLAVLFAAPRSYTGEDVVELHVHGGPGSVQNALAVVLSCGARLAEPGEFTRRAFENGRIDLVQAEAVADLIAAESTRAARAAAHRLDGAAGRALRELRSELLDRLVEIEAHVDYPDEVPEPDRVQLEHCVTSQRERLAKLLAGSGSARALRDGIDCVIAGPPNAGKSSLLNALLDAERAIVSEIPGTTRDIVEDRVAVEGVVLRLRDTAGLRATADVIEAEGVARATRAIEGAELVILVLDGSKPLGADERRALALCADKPRVVLCNKSDLGTAGIAQLRAELPEAAVDDARRAHVAGSVRDRSTIEEIRAAVARIGWGGGAVDANLAAIASVRQIEALTRANVALEHAQATLAAGHPIDLVTVDARQAIAAYGEVTGEDVTAEILDGIFSRFCVGK